tara:strand:- start:726 stop:1262 length:537 start_codon:yes stop_codon:yes gene_type:complete
MGQLTQTFEEVQDMMDRNMAPFRQDIVGSNTISIASADTEYLYVNNGATRNAVSSPSYMTDRWDTTNNKMTAITEYDHPTYVGDIGFVWTPDASNEGTYFIRVYIDESGTRNFATDPIIRTYTGAYKGASATPRNTITTWYWGDETGYDAKNNGVYYTIEFEHTGDVTAPSTVIYNTQ